MCVDLGVDIGLWGIAYTSLRDMTPQLSGENRAETDPTSPLRRTLSASRVVTHTQKVLTNQAEKIAKQADKHEQLISKITYCLGVLSFGTFCYLLGSRPQDIPRLYCTFFIIIAPLRWIYYRIKKWHYYLLDFCYYANAIFITMLLLFPNNNNLFMVCFSFSEGPLAWALIVWRCSLVFSSVDKIVSVLIHLLPGTVFFILRWWDPSTFPRVSAEEVGQFPAWPVTKSIPSLWTWLFFVPLLVYCIWQALYFLVVEGLRRQRILRDPEVMTSYRELKRRAERAKNIWWRLSGLLGPENRVIMYAILQACFTVATLAFTVPMFQSYRLHICFELFKLSAAVWNGGNFIFDVMPKQVAKKEKSKPREVVEGMNGKANSSHSCTTSASSDDVASVADSVVGAVRLKEQDVCALCRRPSSENLSSSMDIRQNSVSSKGKHEDDTASLAMLSSTNVSNQRFLRGTQTACNTRIDSEITGMDWSSQVVCAS